MTESYHCSSTILRFFIIYLLLANRIKLVTSSLDQSFLALSPKKTGFSLIHLAAKSIAQVGPKPNFMDLSDLRVLPQFRQRMDSYKRNARMNSGDGAGELLP